MLLVNRSTRWVATAAFVLAASAGIALAQPLGTSFVYQGELSSGGSPVAGATDLRFRLFDASSSGTQIGSTLCVNDLEVLAGRFSVSLDFGAVFSGQERFLEIEVRQDTTLDCSSGSGFVVLSPRRAIAPTPYALYSLQAGGAATASTAINATQLGGQPAAFYLNAANLSTGVLADERLSANVTTLNSGQTFTATKTFSAPPLFASTGSPFTVSSSTVVTNLNVDLLDGMSSASFGQLAAGQTWAGVNSFTNTGNSFTGSGSGLTALNAAALSTGTVPNARISGTYSSAVTFSSTLNVFAGNASGLTALNATQLISGTVPNGRLGGTYSGQLNLTNPLNTFEGTGTGLTGLNASSLATGTVPNARISGTYSSPITLSNPLNVFVGTGAELTSLNASALTSGTVDDSRLSANIARRDQPNTFAASSNTFAGSVRMEGFQLGSTAPAGFVLRTDANGVGTWQPGGVALPFSATGTGPQPGTVLFSILNNGDGTSISGTSNSATDPAIFGRAFGGTAAGVAGESAASDGRGVTGTATGFGTNYGGFFSSSSPSGTGVYGLTTFQGGTPSGVWGQSDSPSGRGVLGFATATSGSNFGGRFESLSTGGIGVFGQASASSGATYGVWGQVNSGSGVAVYGLTTDPFAGVAGRFETNGQASTSIEARAFATVGNATAARFETSAPNGFAVIGRATNGSGPSHAAQFETFSPDAFGVRAVNFASSGSPISIQAEMYSPSGRAVYGLAASGGGGVSYGVFGQSNSPSGWGLWAQGRSGASGTKSFRIDHPAAPDQKYLLHYSAESPEVLNMYRGTVVLDDAGEATVDLPSYFAAINTDPSYTLTAVGAPMPLLHVSEEISADALATGNIIEPGTPIPATRFRIAGGVAGAKVSWRVEAARNDRWVQRYGAPVEIEKQGDEAGRTQHPELYERRD